MFGTPITSNFILLLVLEFFTFLRTIIKDYKDSLSGVATLAIHFRDIREVKQVCGEVSIPVCN
jgi:hypothetical protein